MSHRATDGEPRGIDADLLAILVCPFTRQPLRYDGSRCELISDAAGLAYPVRDGVPVLLPDEARALSRSG